MVLAVVLVCFMTPEVAPPQPAGDTTPATGNDAPQSDPVAEDSGQAPQRAEIQLPIDDETALEESNPWMDPFGLRLFLTFLGVLFGAVGVYFKVEERNATKRMKEAEVERELAGRRLAKADVWGI